MLVHREGRSSECSYGLLRVTFSCMLVIAEPLREGFLEDGAPDREFFAQLHKPRLGAKVRGIYHRQVVIDQNRRREAKNEHLHSVDAVLVDQI